MTHSWDDTLEAAARAALHHVPNEPAPVVKSVSYDQDELLHAITTLHTGPIELDPTYGKGNFYRTLPRPRLCFDIDPRAEGVERGDVRALLLPDACVSCVAFDPLFMARTGPGATLKERFGELIGTIYELWDFYECAMRELYRVLTPGGWLIFKCQDGVLSGKNNFTHIEVFTRARMIGFDPVDLFILLAHHRMMHPAHTRQVHARKYHAYFWVMCKRKQRVAYTTPSVALPTNAPTDKVVWVKAVFP